MKTKGVRTDRCGNPPEAGQPVECKVLDGVLPLRDHQQGYGGTQAVYLVNNTQDKQVYFKHEVIARGTVIMPAEGETEKVYEQVFPPPQQVNGVRQGWVTRHQPLKKVTPGTQFSPAEEVLCDEHNTSSHSPV